MFNLLPPLLENLAHRTQTPCTPVSKGSQTLRKRSSHPQLSIHRESTDASRVS